MVEKANLFARLVGGGVDGVGPLTQGIHGAFEAKPFDWHVVKGGGLLHEGADEIVGNGMHDDLLADHGRGLTTQHVHAQGALDVTEEQFDGPSAKIKLGELLGGISDGISESGDQDDGLSSEARNGYGDVKESQCERVGKAAPVGEGAALWALFGLLPGNQAVHRAEAFAVTEVPWARLM